MHNAYRGHDHDTNRALRVTVVPCGRNGLIKTTDQTNKTRTADIAGRAERAIDHPQRGRTAVRFLRSESTGRVTVAKARSERRRRRARARQNVFEFSPPSTERLASKISSISRVTPKYYVRSTSWITDRARKNDARSRGIISFRGFFF